MRGSVQFPRVANESWLLNNRAISFSCQHATQTLSKFLDS